MELIAQVFEDSQVTDLVINGPNNVWIDKGFGMQRIDASFFGLNTHNDVKSYALRLARSAYARLDDASPIVDAKLQGGIRLNAVIHPLVSNEIGALISLRAPSRSVWCLRELVEKQMMNKSQADRLNDLVKMRKNIVISGATGSGKTTLLKALLKCVPENERIVGIEEAAEITNDAHPGLVLMHARQANVEGVGEIKLSNLLKATLRMRPDRILLGECRGDEVREFLLALGAGFSGSFTTIHANHASGVRGRIETLAFMSGVYTKLAKNQFDKYVNVVVHLRNTNGKRHIEEILEFDNRDKKAVGLAKMGICQ